MSAPGPGLDPSVLPALRQQPGVNAAVGLTPTTVYLVQDSYPESTTAEAVTPGPVSALLRLSVTSGSLQNFGPGDIALSQAAAQPGPRVGQTVTIYLADGTPYRAKVTAIFSRSLGFADALIPSAAASGGHLGTSALSQVLIGASAGTSPAALTRSIASLSASYPGLQVTSRSVANAQYEQGASQDSYINNLLLAVVGLLVSVALVNMLVVVTLQRRKEPAVLRRIGATTRQLVARHLLPADPDLEGIHRSGPGRQAGPDRVRDQRLPGPLLRLRPVRAAVPTPATLCVTTSRAGPEPAQGII